MDGWTPDGVSARKARYSTYFGAFEQSYIRAIGSMEPSSALGFCEDMQLKRDETNQGKFVGEFAPKDSI